MKLCGPDVIQQIRSAVELFTGNFAGGMAGRGAEPASCKENFAASSVSLASRSAVAFRAGLLAEPGGVTEAGDVVSHVPLRADFEHTYFSDAVLTVAGR